MEFSGKVVLIKSSQIIDIVRHSLSKIDARLVDHGERVGYIAKKIYEQCPDKSELDFSKLFVLCVLHDIGAYKTSEIDDMLRFESETPFDHSLYGYLFLKNTTHLSEYAEAILYHHTDYSVLAEINCRYSRYAEIIHLADRADIIINSSAQELSSLEKMKGSKFSPQYVDALLSAQSKHGIVEKILSGEYRTENEAVIDSLNIREDEIMDYLKLLVYAIDFRSPYTVTHTADTAIISMELGTLLGLNSHDMQALYIGAFLHDIGKIAISHDILDKPGRLTPEEFDIIKHHIPEGEEILRGVVSDEICDIALRHHEKLDGSGYSKGIKGEELTLPQRIVAVADILSALSQERSYKSAFPKEKVISILVEMRDSGFLCKRVVDTACENYDLILNNTAKSHDPVKTMYEKLLDEYKQHKENEA
ncbi:MAG: HD domain-containing protein [Clostridiales bacterium]|nr:HD domain-containing protein [Clostridiales bacterium]